MLFRHGAAEHRAAPCEDAQRRLTPAGRHTVLHAARGLRTRIERISLIVSSPLPRALETAHILAKIYRPRHGLLEHTDVRPGGNTQRLAAVLCALRMPAIVVAGHEPGLTQLARRFIGSEAFRGLHLSKSGACLLELGGAPPYRARLRWLLSAHELQQLT